MKLSRMILISGVLHALFITLSVFGTFPGKSMTLYRPQYQVRLVDSSEIPGLNPPPAKEAAQVEQAAEPAKEEKKAVVVPEKKEEPPAPVEKAKDKPKQPPQTQKASRPSAQKDSAAKKSQNSIAEAIKRIQKDLKKRDMVASSGPYGSGGLTGMEGSLEYSEYYNQIEQRVRQNWIAPEKVDQKMETVVSLSILPDGNIQQSWIEKSSGDRYFDESVMRAILKSNPLPPPPAGFARPSFEVGLRFKP